MSKKLKLFEKALNNPKNLFFGELETLLSQFGFVRIKTNAGSHMKWKNYEKQIVFFVPKKNPVKPYMLKNF